MVFFIVAETIIGFTHITGRIHVISIEITEQQNLLNGKEFLSLYLIVCFNGFVLHTTKQMFLRLHCNLNKLKIMSLQQ